jgi:iron complex transport system ATP-binding protein
MGTVPESPVERESETSARPAAVAVEPAPAVRIDGLTVRYGPILALDDAHLTVEPGQIVAVIGPNGSGKSTLLSAISGLVQPTRGSVRVHGRPPRQGSPRVAHVLQTTIANEAVPLTVIETVRMGCYARTGPFRPLSRQDRAAVADAVERMRIGDLARRQLHELSGGQRQRVYVAQGLAQRADVLLLDEPITGLDLITQETITEVMRAERAAGRAVVFTTHDVGTARLADRTVLVATSVIAEGPPAEVLTPGNLARAYGGHLHVLDDGTIVLDEPSRHGPDDTPSAPHAHH